MTLFDILSRPKTSAFLAVVLPQTFLTFRRRVISPTLQNLAAATSWKISVKGFPRRVKRAFLKPVFHRLQGRKKKRTTPIHAARWCEAHAAPRQKNAKRSRHGLT
jgi:hypothetical protein